ncbi:FkbM family methyltransferase [Rhodohalobacter sp. 8-1]|uniref:FkbM family methyltransferase n=1 Tax=Rhodohalobacter sp. 8-1 TaxID=3131972 RepID=UPI0030EEE21F
MTPKFVLSWYKERQYYSIISDFDITTEPDLLVAMELADKERVTVDIGANIGLYTVYLSPASSKVVSIEPVPFTFTMLTKVIDRFKLSNVSAGQFAISDSVGEARIEIPVQAGARNYYRASLLDVREEDDSKFYHKVKTKTIDSLFLDDATKISLIKCDVEGHELKCVKGAGEFLKRSRPSWMIEVSEDLDDHESSAFQLKAFMERFNYKTYLYENGVLRAKKEGDKSINYFFLQDVHLQKLKKSPIKVVL